jgi:hypothetical protein
VLVLVLVSSLWLAGAAMGGTEPASVPVRHHVVAEGETLWGIARSLVGPQGDPRPLIDRIRRANGLGSGMLLEGQSLVVPAG